MSPEDLNPDHKCVRHSVCSSAELAKPAQDSSLCIMVQMVSAELSIRSFYFYFAKQVIESHFDNFSEVFSNHNLINLSPQSSVLSENTQEYQCHCPCTTELTPSQILGTDTATQQRFFLHLFCCCCEVLKIIILIITPALREGNRIQFKFNPKMDDTSALPPAVQK